MLNNTFRPQNVTFATSSETKNSSYGFKVTLKRLSAQWRGFPALCRGKLSSAGEKRYEVGEGCRMVGNDV